MSTTDDKFSLFFKKIKLNVNDDKNPSLVDLQNSYYSCNQKLNDFNKKYKTKYNDLFTILNKRNVDEQLLKSTLQDLNVFVNENQKSINECYKSILGKEKEIMNYDDKKMNKSDVKSVIKEIQEETNQKYKDDCDTDIDEFGYDLYGICKKKNFVMSPEDFLALTTSTATISREISHTTYLELLTNGNN